MQNIILSPISIDDFKNVISETVRQELRKLTTTQTPPEPEYITRKEAARILDITLPTLHDWTKKGIIQGYRIATRIRYKKAEINTALQKIRTLKYGGVQ